MAKTIEALGKPTLVMAPNKTLAAQLASELKEFFPHNAVVYFVSYYDYYQPEAYVPQSDTYIEKDSSINEEVEMLRHQATASLLSRRDVIVVASVSCIYGIGSPEDYAGLAPNVDKKVPLERDEFIHCLIDIQYDRNDYDLSRGCFRVRGDVVDVYPPYAEHPLRFEFFGDEVELIAEIDEVTGEILREYDAIPVWPASHYVTEKPKVTAALKTIEEELEHRVAELKAEDKLLEAQRLQQRTDYDLRCSRPWASPTASRTTRATWTAASPASPRSRSSTTSPRTWSASSTRATSPCRRSAACTRATARARSRWSSTVSACRPPGQPPASLRRVRGAHPAVHLRIGHAGRLRAAREPKQRGADHSPHRPARSQDRRAPRARSDR